jgi:hypothetical protein
MFAKWRDESEVVGVTGQGCITIPSMLFAILVIHIISLTRFFRFFGCSVYCIEWERRR